MIDCVVGIVFVGFDKDNVFLCVKFEEKDYMCAKYLVFLNGVVKCFIGSKLRAVQMNGDCMLLSKAEVFGCFKSECVKCLYMTLMCCKTK